jgi:hypothetical protein
MEIKGSLLCQKEIATGPYPEPDESNIHIHIFANRPVLEKLTVTQLVKKFSDFYGNSRFITVLKRDRHWSLS